MYSRECRLFRTLNSTNFRPPSLITRTTNDITQIQLLIVLMVRMLFYAAILGTGGAIKAISESRTLSWIIVAAVLAMVMVIIILFNFVMPKMRIDANACG